MKKNGTDFDAAVIGGGLGGLSAGALLASRGYKVFLAERNEEVGGNASVVRRGGYSFERALHQVYGLGSTGTQSAGLLREMGVDRKVEFIELPAFMEVVFPGLRFLFPADAGELEAALCRRFPAERRAISKMLEQGRSLYRMDRMLKSGGWRDRLRECSSPAAELRNMVNSAAMMRYAKRTFGDYCREHFRSPELVAILGAPWVYLGVPPGRVPAMMMVAMLGAFTAEKPFYIRGGSRSLSEALAGSITARGGTVRTGAPVRRILTAAGAAKGVELEDGTRVDARCVISNAPARLTFGAMLGASVAPAPYLSRLRGMSTSLSAFHLLIGAELDIGRLERPPVYATSFYRGLDHDENYALTTQGEISSFGLCLHSLADPSQAPRGCSSLAVITLSPWRGRAYWKKNRAARADRLIDMVESVLPGLRSKVREMEIFDPASIEARTGVDEGAIYGWENKVGQTLFDRLPQVSPVRGLFLSGQWTSPGSGMTMAIQSGGSAAKLAAEYVASGSGKR
ncbi:MAG: NAD(P)/FAD-dependent oxidoreductase [Elusimicrobia bacterium]|nr:NAD(P)/FAD-dependent oxidoreductase [Elusimicrobiota bacterium]